MKKRIAVVAGGNSSEAEISFKSAAQMLSNVDANFFEAWQINIRNMDWFAVCPDQQQRRVDKNDFSVEFDQRKIQFDCVLMAIHGNPGEDGYLQAYFKMLGIPVTTCNMFVSALTFNKYACKKYLGDLHIPTAKAMLFRKNNPVDVTQIIHQLGLPVFVKPNNGGSSFGASKVKSPEEFMPAFEKAFEHDHEVIVEEFIKGTEVTCGICQLSGTTYLLPPTEVVSKNEFFDYEAKYTDGMAMEITPARIPDDQITECQQLSNKIYQALDCNGVVRIDYLIKEGMFYFMEVNTVPGMSANSIVPKQLKQYGLDMKAFITLLIEDALSRNS